MSPTRRYSRPPHALVLGQAFIFAVLGSTQPLAAERTAWTGSKVVGSPEPPSLARVERIFGQLTFTKPLDALHDATRHRWWIAQESGQLLTFPDADNPRKTDLALDLAAQKPFAQLLGFTFDPDHVRNGYVYVAYVRQGDQPDGSRVSRFKLLDGAAPRIDPASELVILTWLGGGHNGCSLKFGPDGMLYVSTGDGASPEPPDARNTGQSLDDLLSAILRIDVRDATPAAPYRIPKDNPFIQRTGARPEIWAYGFRNPWRTAFAPDGALWLGDVGWELWETVHRVTSGYNGGWSRVEGPLLVRPDLLAPTPIGKPIAAHGHHEAASITGGLFYSGTTFPSLRGTYLYGDWETGKIWSLAGDATHAPVEIADTNIRVVSFASGPDREMYVVDYQGGLYRIVPNDAAPQGKFPRRLSETGLFSDTPRQLPAPGVVAYGIAAGRWHDGADASRWIAVPGTATVTPGPNYGFPPGTVFAKTLSLPRAVTEPSRTAPVETQLLHLSPDGWRGYSYRWNTSGTDAELVGPAGEVATVPFPDPNQPGGSSRSWTFPARSDCLRCHNLWPGFVLGFNSSQLADAVPSGLRGLVTGGLVVSNEFCKPTFQLISPTDASAPLETRARSWLHANCAPCHRFGAGGAVAARFGADEPLAKLNVIDAKPARGDFGLPDARIIAPGHPERSAAWYRINTTGAGHMPPLGSRRPDPTGSRVLADWIRSLSPTPAPPAKRPESVVSAIEALRWLDATLPSAPPANVVRTALAGTNAAARDLMAAFAPPELQRDTLGENIDPARILALTGNISHGRQLFLSDSGPGCARCHRVEPGAILAGPSLAGLGGRQDRPTILDSVLNPSAQVAPEFQWHEGELTDGTPVSGFVVSRTAFIELRQQDGSIQRHEAARVKRLSPTASSLMPEGLLASLTAQEAADLLAYLASLR